MKKNAGQHVEPVMTESPSFSHVSANLDTYVEYLQKSDPESQMAVFLKALQAGNMRLAQRMMRVPHVELVMDESSSFSQVSAKLDTYVEYLQKSDPESQMVEILKSLQAGNVRLAQRLMRVRFAHDIDRTASIGAGVEKRGELLDASPQTDRPSVFTSLYNRLQTRLARSMGGSPAAPSSDATAEQGVTASGHRRRAP